MKETINQLKQSDNHATSSKPIQQRNNQTINQSSHETTKEENSRAKYNVVMQ